MIARVVLIRPLVAVILICGLALTGAVPGVSAASAEQVGRIGDAIDNFVLRDFRRQEVALEDLEDHKVVVLAFLGTECPLAKLYGTRLAELDRNYRDQGVAFLGINSNVQDSITEMAAYAERHGIEFPLLKDVGNRLADAVGATRTPEVIVLSRGRVISYRGRIDDQYGVGVVRDQAHEHDLQQALDELLAGQPVSQPVTKPVGCLIGRVRQPDAGAEVTYSNQIARLMQGRCVECHREGEIAPFALVDYDEVAGWAEMILEVVEERRMPPWHASDDVGRFSNDRALSDEERALIRQWVAAGAPEGDQADLPEPRTYATGWQLSREPDFIAPIVDEPFVVPAEGKVDYQYFMIDPGFEEEKWVSAIEIQPGNRQVVHHVLMFAGKGRDAVRRFRGGALGYDGGYVPGQRAEAYPKGYARRIEAGSQLIFQVHYTPIGSEQLDQSRVGMWFVEPAEVLREVRTLSAVGRDIDIPPGEANYRLAATSLPLRHDAELLQLAPHMHYRGKSFRYEAVLPDGPRQPLLDVPTYDFNWQTAYRLSERLPLPAGTQIHCDAGFDNSASNLANPDPSQRVRWGEQTWDEMMIGYFDYAVPKGTPLPGEHIARGDRVQRLFNRFDANGDGRIRLAEVPEKHHELFHRLDKNNDSELTIKELTRILLLVD